MQRHLRHLIFPLLLCTPLRLDAQSCALNLVSGPETLANGSFSYCSVYVSAGTTLFIGGAVTLNVAGNVDVEGEVYGVGSGYGSSYAPSGGPGAGGDGSVSLVAGVTLYSGGGGGGHGGTGGGVTSGAAGGPAYDSVSGPVSMGSAGGSGANNPNSGGAGGAALLLTAPSGYVTLNGTVDMSGGNGVFASPATQAGGGGGAGGTLSVDALGIYGSGTLSAAGGTGGPNFFNKSGGGAGGRVRLCASNGAENFTGSMDVAGGPSAGGVPCLACPPDYSSFGQDGTYFDCNPTNTPTATPTSTATLTPTPTDTGTPTATPSWTPSSTPTPSVTVTPTATPTSTPTPLPCPPGYRGPNPPGPGDSFTYPAPATGGSVDFAYYMKEAGIAEIPVWNERGDLAAEVKREQGCGPQQAVLDIRGFAAGVYFYQVRMRYDSGGHEDLKVGKFAVIR